MVEEVVVRESNIDDAISVNAKVVEFDAEYIGDEFAGRVAGKEHLVLVAYVDSQPAGYVIGYDRYDDGSFYCWMAGVDPEFRKRGLLNKMMTYEDSWAKDKGYSKLRIKTRNRNREMLSFLVNYGFQFIDVDQRNDVGDYRIELEKEL